MAADKIKKTHGRRLTNRGIASSEIEYGLSALIYFNMFLDTGPDEWCRSGRLTSILLFAEI